MQVFRELFIRGEPDQLSSTAECIRRSLANDWAIDQDAEEHMRSMAASTHRQVHCFACTKRGHRPAATLFLVEKEPTTLYVANIVPHDKHELSYDEYNGILEEFVTRF